jgi:cytochrome bd ubiquinol oxidase subunit II
MEASHLALFWASVICGAIVLYTILDGFDLGVGVLFGTTREEALRVQMMNTIAPFWDGNETWLVVVGAAAVGAWIRGIPVANGQYAGGTFGWLHPFSILTGIGLLLGYALLGAGFLALKNQGELRDWANRRIRWLAAGVLVVLLLAFTLTFDYSVVAQSGLHARPWGLVFPVIGLLALGAILVGVRGRRDQLPFVLTVVFFLAAFLTLAVMFWPYMIPYSITVADAAAPDASLQFIWYGAIMVLPVILAYTVGVYWIFRGK